jgi:hypothetical protein
LRGLQGGSCCRSARGRERPDPAAGGQAARIVADAEQAACELLSGVEEIVERLHDVFGRNRRHRWILVQRLEHGAAERLFDEPCRDAIGSLDDLLCLAACELQG